MPEEHTGQLGFEYAWKELLARTRQAGMHVFTVDNMVLCSTFCDLREFLDVQHFHV